MRKVGILGASGFVGARVVESFHLRNVAQVVPIVRRPAALAPVVRFDLEWRLADALDQSALARAFEGCDVVVHSVMGHLGQIPLEPEPAYRAAEEAGVRRIVYLSSASVHGQNPPPGTDESAPLDRRQPFQYNNAKIRAEDAFLRLRGRGGVEVVILRPSIVFGPGDTWITGMARALSQREPYLVKGGHGICNTTYVDNLVHAIELAMTADADGEACIIVDRESVTWREIYTRVALELFGRDPDGAIEEFDLEAGTMSLRERLRWSPTYRSLKRYLPETVRARLGQVAAGVGMQTGGAAPSGADSGKRARRRVPYDLAMLHDCGWKLPYAKAERLLGYEPRVSVQQGVERAIAWLRVMRPDIQLEARASSRRFDAVALQHLGEGDARIRDDESFDENRQSSAAS